MRTVILMRIIIFVLLMLPTIIFAQDSDFYDTKALAEQGDASAQYAFGTMWLNGEGAPKNLTNAVKWF